MKVYKRNFVYFKQKIFLLILLSLFIYPFNNLTSRAQIIYQTPVLSSESLNIMPAVNIEYFHSAKVEVQGRSETPRQAKEKTGKIKSDINSAGSSVQVEKDFISNADYKLPEINYRSRRVVTAVVTAYNPVPEQTDSTPCLTANGTDICSEKKNIIAANWLPFGTKVQIPDYFGDKIFEVQDRMNERYSDRVDVLMYDLSEAKNFGRRKLRIVILD